MSKDIFLFRHTKYTILIQLLDQSRLINDFTNFFTKFLNEFITQTTYWSSAHVYRLELPERKLFKSHVSGIWHGTYQKKKLIRRIFYNLTMEINIKNLHNPISLYYESGRFSYPSTWKFVLSSAVQIIPGKQVVPSLMIPSLALLTIFLRGFWHNSGKISCTSLNSI